jgi:hypothetical protein
VALRRGDLVAGLRQAEAAVADGFGDTALVRTYRGLDPLRGHAQFHALVEGTARNRKKASKALGKARSRGLGADLREVSSDPISLIIVTVLATLVVVLALGLRGSHAAVTVGPPANAAERTSSSPSAEEAANP